MTKDPRDNEAEHPEKDDSRADALIRDDPQAEVDEYLKRTRRRLLGPP